VILLAKGCKGPETSKAVRKRQGGGEKKKAKVNDRVVYCEKEKQGAPSKGLEKKKKKKGNARGGNMDESTTEKKKKKKKRLTKKRRGKKGRGVNWYRKNRGAGGQLDHA